MKLRVQGSIHEYGKFAEFDNFLEDLLGNKGKKISQAVPDTFVIVDEVGEDFLRFQYVYGLKTDEITLKLGENYDFSYEGNAYGFKVTFTLVE